MAKIAALLDKNCPVTENSFFTSIFGLLRPFNKQLVSLKYL